MPIYSIINTITSEEEEMFCSYSSLVEFLEKNPDYRQVPCAPAINYRGVGDEVKRSDGFNEVMAKIGEAHPASPHGERYRKNKTIKEVKTQEVVKKHLG